MRQLWIAGVACVMILGIVGCSGGAGPAPAPPSSEPTVAPTATSEATGTTKVEPTTSDKKMTQKTASADGKTTSVKPSKLFKFFAKPITDSVGAVSDTVEKNTSIGR